MKTTTKQRIDKQILWIFITAVLSMFLLFFITGFVIPLISNMLNMFLIQLETYLLLTNPTAKFFAGFIFLFIYFKIFESFIYAIIFNAITKSWKKADLK